MHDERRFDHKELIEDCMVAKQQIAGMHVV